MVYAQTPVIVGGGQWTNRVDQGSDPVEPVDLIAEVLRRAAADTGCSSPGRVVASADAVWVVQMFSWRYANPAALVAQRLGADPGDTAMSPVGGNEPQALVNQACKAIQSGDAEVVLIGGAEAWRSRSKPGGKELGWTAQDDPAIAGLPPARLTGDEAQLNHPVEIGRGAFLPTQLYPLFEQALRHAAGCSLDDHQDHLGSLWSHFSKVAANNEHAWLREPLTAEQVRTPSPYNRWIGWPYTKVMNANNAVEQGAGLIVTSAEKAVALGIPSERWIFPLASVESHDHYAVSHRENLHSSPAIRLAGRRLFELTGIGPDDLAHIDLYSCFPSAVQIAAVELGIWPGGGDTHHRDLAELGIWPGGLPNERDLTVTGGLSFAGGPWNNYVSHSLATMVGVLREDPGSVGLVTANGGYLTKHALGLYSTEPPRAGFQWASVQDEVDALPRREVVDPAETAAAVQGEIESWVVMHDRDNQPEKAIATVLLDDERRAWATSADAATLAALVSGEDHITRKVEITPEAELRI